MQKKWMIFFALSLALALSACNLPEPATTATPAVLTTLTLPPAVVSATPLPPTSAPQATDTVAPTQAPPTLAPTATFPPVITATNPPPTATKTLPPPVIATQGPAIKISTIKMFDLNVGWAIGQVSANDNQVFKTANGGKTWKSVTPPEPGRAGKTAVAFFLDANHAWVNYSGLPGGTPPTDFTVWRTADGGATWKSAKGSLSGVTLEGFTTDQIAFFDASDGWLLSTVGAGMSHTYIVIYTTSDGGATWKAVVTPDKNNVSMSCGKSGVWFRDAAHGIISGNCFGVIKGLYLYTTANGGATWTLLTLPAPASLPTAFTDQNNVCGADAPRFFDAQKGTLVVSCANVNSNKNYRWVYQTKDGGATWTSAPMPRPFGGFYFLTADSGWYLGMLTADNYSDVKVYTTADGGKTWKEISGTHWSGDQDYLDAKNGWVIAKTASDLALVRTVDGGLTYALLNPQVAP